MRDTEKEEGTNKSNDSKGSWVYHVPCIWYIYLYVQHVYIYNLSWLLETRLDFNKNKPNKYENKTKKNKDKCVKFINNNDDKIATVN